MAPVAPTDVFSPQNPVLDDAGTRAATSTDFSVTFVAIRTPLGCQCVPEPCVALLFDFTEATSNDAGLSAVSGFSCADKPPVLISSPTAITCALATAYDVMHDV